MASSLTTLSDPRGSAAIMNETFPLAPDGCIPIRFSQMEFLPWNNSDNIVSEHVEVVSRKIRFGIQQFTFYIGVPANLINMAVFLKQGITDRVNLILFSLSLADEIFLIIAMLLNGEEFYLEAKGDVNPGPMLKFIVNHNLGGFMGSTFVSFTLSAIIACERCYCVLRPLKYQTLMRTRTMAIIIIMVYVVVMGLNFVAVFRFHFGCFYDLDTQMTLVIFSESEFYLRHKVFIDNLDNIFFGAGVPVIMAIVLVSATGLTAQKLKQAVEWRSETSSTTMSSKEIALTKMLIGTSILLSVCMFPSCLFRVACLFLPEVSTGRRHQNFYLTGLWVTEMFLFINSSFNVFIYFVMGSRYRQTFFALFPINRCKM